MKLRISKDLHTRARLCAEDIQEPLGEWARRCLVQYRKGKFRKFSRVAKVEISKDATRSGSVVVTLTGTQADADMMRKALHFGILYCESRMLSRFSTPLVEGKDYFVEPEIP